MNLQQPPTGQSAFLLSTVLSLQLSQQLELGSGMEITASPAKLSTAVVLMVTSSPLSQESCLIMSSPPVLGTRVGHRMF